MDSLYLEETVRERLQAITGSLGELHSELGVIWDLI